jgi:hypothetical protein
MGLTFEFTGLHGFSRRSVLAAELAILLLNFGLDSLKLEENTVGRTIKYSLSAPLNRE